MTLEFGGRLHPVAGLKFQDHAIELPAGMSQLTVKVRYTRTNDTFPVLLLFDPNGWRGELGLIKAYGEVELQLTLGQETSPSAVPGPLPPGCWTVHLAALWGAEPLDYRGVVEVEMGGRSGTGATTPFFPSLTHSLRSEPGWYRGDFHL
ncbi:MAG TPA: hypothetical protein EYH31_03180, partial [Anaerolineae bacterium]|nr:hypothetical protein [Anaerolineae bacterium]